MCFFARRGGNVNTGSRWRVSRWCHLPPLQQDMSHGKDPVPFWKNLVAGGGAGAIEICVMFPLDVIKAALAPAVFRVVRLTAAPASAGESHGLVAGCQLRCAFPPCCLPTAGLMHACGSTAWEPVAFSHTRGHQRRARSSSRASTWCA